MITQSTQIKITLPLALKEFLASKAAKYDMPIAGYVKHLIMKDVEEMDYPVFKASKKIEQEAEEALTDYDNAIEVSNVDEYFKNL